MRQFSAWLDVFNSGDRDRYAEFLAGSFPSRLESLEKAMAFREDTGGFDLRKLERVSATEAVALVQERDSDARLSEDEAITGVEDVLRGAAAADRFSGTVLIEKNGHVLFSRAFGLADRERGIPNTLQTRFRVGSMNKMFTGVAVLQLAEAGRVELTAPVGEYLTGCRNQDVAAKVTVHHLLTHTGGTGGIFGLEFKAHRLELRALDYDYVHERVYGPARMTATGSRPEASPFLTCQSDT